MANANSTTLKTVTKQILKSVISMVKGNHIRYQHQSTSLQIQMEHISMLQENFYLKLAKPT